MKRLEEALSNGLAQISEEGRRKGKEQIISDIIPAAGEFGPRYKLRGFGDKRFIRMNSNSYLGLSQHPQVVAAEEVGTRRYGVGPGAVRFISGTFEPHRELEKSLAAFHLRDDAMIFSSAYVTVCGVLIPLITPNTVVISDELNHNCIINALRLSRPMGRLVYKHNNMNDLQDKLRQARDMDASRLIVVTDGIFSMRGDYAPMSEIVQLVRDTDSNYPENAIVVMDDSHGVGAFGEGGRGTEGHTGAQADILIGTLGKAYGVNGGYVVSSQTVITYLRENAPMYIYSNPISAGEACATMAALKIIDSPDGTQILSHLSDMTKRFEQGLVSRGLETIPGPHPVTPLVVRDTARTSALVAHLLEHGIMATGLTYPVIPKGSEEIRFQVNASHTASDIDYVLAALDSFRG